MEDIGKGVSYTVDNKGIMTIVIDTNQDFGSSASGKSTIIASSSGNAKVEVGGDVAYLGLNLYRKV